MESSIWDLPIVNKNELYLLDAIVHKVKEGETLYGDIIPKYYKEYLNTKQKIKLPTFGYSNDMSDLETFKFDLVHTILEMNNLIHPRMIPSNKNIFLPNFEFKDVVKNGCNYAVKNEKQIGLWTVKDPNTGLVVSKLENIEIFIRTESDWKILMDTEWLDDSIELAVLTSGLLALATYNDSELTKAKECGDDGFIFIRRPNLLELRNIFNALFYEKVDLPNHFFERSTRYFPSTIVVAKFIEKFIPIFLRMDSFIFNNFDTIDNRVFISKNIKALAEQSADLISNDLLIKSILSGSISSFIKGIIIKVSLDINYFSEKHLLKVTSSERKKIKEVKVDLSLGSKVLIKNSLIVYGITNNIYKRKLIYGKILFLRYLIILLISFLI
ncbi:MAG: hypothetical protein R2774_10075 [Saprospiraceae bacterium]